MKPIKYLLSFIVVCSICGVFFSPLLVYANEHEANRILVSAESLFKAMKERNYTETWKHLTAESKRIIVDNVYRTSVKLGNNPSRERLNDDFHSGKATAKAYWNSYMTAFDPGMVLEQSTWKIHLVKKEYAEINILYVKSNKPATLQLYKEDGIWKVGLEETFRPRKWLY
jgi:hypothetical protein